VLSRKSFRGSSKHVSGLANRIANEVTIASPAAMSERGNFRGGGRGGRGGRGGGGAERGGRGGGQAPGGDRKKENILDLSKYMEKEITVKFSGGREGKIGCVMQIVGLFC
jgi:hypothetical protein